MEAKCGLSSNQACISQHFSYSKRNAVTFHFLRLMCIGTETGSFINKSCIKCVSGRPRADRISRRQIILTVAEVETVSVQQLWVLLYQGRQLGGR